MSKHSQAVANTCADVGDFPSDYSNLLPKGANVPAFETSSTNSAPASKTWYFPIRLDAANPTGVFIPQDFTYPNKGEKVDVILFFHGNKVGDFGKFPNNNINYYWSGHYAFGKATLKIKLRENLNASRKNALLVAPTMGPLPGHQLAGNPDLGIFAQPGGGDCFLDHVMKWLGHCDPRFDSVQVGKVVLAGHSGGGSAIHIQMNSMKADIGEVWCFDVVYWMLEDWTRFAKTLAITHPNSLITFYHGVQSTNSYNDLDALAKSMGKKYKKEDRMTAGGTRNMNFVETGKPDHFGALTDHFLERLQDSSCCLSTI
jgi:hypothetical protein